MDAVIKVICNAFSVGVAYIYFRMLFASFDSSVAIVVSKWLQSIILFSFLQKFNNGLSKYSPNYMSGFVCRGVILEEEFTPTQCVERLKKDFGGKLFAVVDLTNTSKYYSARVSPGEHCGPDIVGVFYPNLHTSSLQQNIRIQYCVGHII